MNWLSGRCGNVVGSMTLGAIVLGLLSVVPATGHATGRTDGARREAAVVANARVAAPRSVAVPTRSNVKPAGCNEALDALALCKLSTATSEGASRRAGVDGGASDPALVQPVSKPIGASGTAFDPPGVAVETPARLLPVFALGLALAALLLGWLGFRAIPSTAGSGVPGRANAFRIGMPKRSATAAVAKERLLHYRTLPN